MSGKKADTQIAAQHDLWVFVWFFFGLTYLCCSMAKEVTKLQGTVLPAFVWLSLTGIWAIVVPSFYHSYL